MKVKVLTYTACAVALMGMTGGVLAADQMMTADVVIVGAGAGGLTAGVAAVDAGLKTVVLEKNAVVGGGGNYMEGTFFVGSALQKADNVGVTPERQFKRVMDFHHWRINGRAFNNWLKKTPSVYDWLGEHGVHYEAVKTAFIDGNRTWHMYKGGHGTVLVSEFSKQIKEKGGKILTSTPATELIIENGVVKGVKAKAKNGDTLTIRADNTIIATGGFSGNKEMVAKYLPYAGYEGAGSPGRTGDGVRMLESAGADLVNMNVCMQAGLWLKGVPTDLQFGKDGVTKAEYVRLLAALFQPYLKTSLKGDRVADETLPLEYISNAYEEVGGEGFAVFDDKTRLEMINSGLPRGYFGMVTPGTKFTNFDELFERGVKDGFCFKADTLEELARLTGMDPKRLASTVERMNELVKLGKDEDFYKDPQWLREVKTGPFYAIKGSLRMYATTGGARVNEYFQPLDAKGNVIRGIYAIGQDAGGLYSDSYDMHIAEGTASSWAICGGKLSVDHILSSKQQK